MHSVPISYSTPNTASRELCSRFEQADETNLLLGETGSAEDNVEVWEDCGK